MHTSWGRGRTENDQTGLHSASDKEAGMERRTSLWVKEDLGLWMHPPNSLARQLPCWKLWGAKHWEG